MLAATARILLRRWLWVLVIVALAIASGAGIFAVAKPEQQNSAQVLFVPSVHEAGISGLTNPFLQLGGSTAIVASVVAARVSGTRVSNALASEGATANYTVSPNLAENAGPVLLVTVKDTSAAVSNRTLAALLARISTELRTVQLGQHIPSTQLISALVLTSTTRPSVVRKHQLQDVVIGAVVVLLVLLAVLVLVERRRFGREAVGSPPKAPTDDEPTDDEPTNEALSDEASTVERVG